MDCEAEFEFSENELQLMQTLLKKFDRVLCQQMKTKLIELLKRRIPNKTREKVAWVWRIFDQWYELWRIRTDSLKVWKDYNEWQKPI